MMVRIDGNGWVRCGKCGHKLMRVVGESRNAPPPMIEVKCHSCKEINIWTNEGLKSPITDSQEAVGVCG